MDEVDCGFGVVDSDCMGSSLPAHTSKHRSEVEEEKQLPEGESLVTREMVEAQKAIPGSTQPLIDTSAEAWLMQCSWVMSYGITPDGKLDVYIEAEKNTQEALKDIIQNIDIPEDMVTLYHLAAPVEFEETSLAGTVKNGDKDIVIGGLLSPSLPGGDFFAFSVTHLLEISDKLIMESVTGDRRLFGEVIWKKKENYNDPERMSIDFALIKMADQSVCAIDDKQALAVYSRHPPDSVNLVKKWGPSSGHTQGILQYVAFYVKLDKDNRIRSLAVKDKDKDTPFHKKGDSGSLVLCQINPTAVGLLMGRSELKCTGKEPMPVSLVCPLADSLQSVSQDFQDIRNCKVYYVGPTIGD